MSKTKTSAISRLSQAVKEVEKEVAEMTKGSPMQVENIYLPLNHLFNAAAKRAFKIEVKELNPVRQVTAVATTQFKVKDTVRYFGARAVGERKIFDAAQKVANKINELANHGFVSGVLTKLVAIKLATEPFQLEQYVVISYVAVTDAGLEWLRKNPTELEMQEGEIPSFKLEEE